MDGIRLLIILTQLKHWHHSGESTVMVKRNRSRFNISRKIKSHFKGGEIRPERRSMETFHIYTPMANGEHKPDKVEIFMSFFTPGKENAIKRDDLTQKCVDAGLINADVADKDRAMRNILKRAKLDYSITNDGDGTGYYRPTKEESKRLEKNHKRERKKGISTIVGEKYNGATLEDYKHDRMVVE